MDRCYSLPSNAIVGMVHLQPLPGSPRFAGDLDEVEAKAVQDARILVAGGVDAIMVENFGDAPFHATEVETVTVAAMTRIVSKLIDDVTSQEGVQVGVNVLRNDASAALSIAAATGADFIRVNVHTGAMLTDQGSIEGKAAETLRLRKRLGVDPGSEHAVGIFADVGVKHASPLESDWTLEREAIDCWKRGLADALIVSGSGTGSGTSPDDLARVRTAVPDCNLLVGSGVDESNIKVVSSVADAMIVGSSLKPQGIDSPIDLGAVNSLVESRNTL